MPRPLKISFLLFFLALCGAAILGTHLARQRTPPPVASQLYSVINRQLSAFRAADYDDAYRHVAAGLQEQFSRAQFELMIRRDFSLMTRAQRVEFGAVHIAGPAALVQVLLTDRDGAVRGFLYSFALEPDGWKIDGVQPLGAEPVGRLPGLHI